MCLLSCTLFQTDTTNIMEPISIICPLFVAHGRESDPYYATFGREDRNELILALGGRTVQTGLTTEVRSFQCILS